MTIDRRDIAHELAFLHELGFTHLDLPSPATAAIMTDSLPSNAPRDRAMAAVPAGTDEIDAMSTLQELAVLAAPCVRCRLAMNRTQVVFGVGNPSAELMFIGEAPGRDEDLQGKPFVGRAGQLLTDIIKAMKYTRDDVYIANVIKCRPPENRNPEPDELDACRPYIQKQIELIRPKVIVTLGRFALQSTMQKPISITSTRGQWLKYRDIPLMPTYHPAYLLRTPAAKKDVWNDMKKVMSELGRTI